MNLKNINEEHTKEEQKKLLIVWLMDCFDMSEESARSFVEKSFGDLKETEE